MEFAQMWNEISTKYKNYKDQLILRITEEFNKMYKDPTSEDDELPF